MNGMRDHNSDEQLAGLARQGQRAAFDSLVRRHAQRLYGFLARRLGDKEEARDVCQQVFFQAWKGLHRYDPARDFKPWLYTLARRQAASHARRKRPLPQPGVEKVDDRDPARLLAERETHDELWTWVRTTLSPSQFTAFWLHTEESFRIREIARIMGKTESHVKVLLYRSRRNLTAALAASRNRKTHAACPLHALLQPVVKGEPLS